MWERCLEPDLKSCIKHPCPRASKRTLRTDENGEQDQLLPQGVKFIKRIEVNEEDGFQVTQRPGAVFITQFDTRRPTPPPLSRSDADASGRGCGVWCPHATSGMDD